MTKYSSSEAIDALEARLAVNLSYWTEWPGRGEPRHIIEAPGFAMQGTGYSEEEAIKDFLWRNDLVWERD